MILLFDELVLPPHIFEFRFIPAGDLVILLLAKAREQIQYGPKNTNQNYYSLNNFK